MKRSCGASGCRGSRPPDTRRRTRGTSCRRPVDGDAPNGDAGGQRDLALRHRRVRGEVLDRERGRRALVGGEREGRRHPHRQRRRPRPQRGIRAPSRRRRRRRGNARPGSRAPARSRRRSPSARRARRDIAGASAPASEHRDLRRAVRQRRQPDVEADRRDVMDLDRNDARRQPASAARERAIASAPPPRAAGGRRRGRRRSRRSTAASGPRRRGPGPTDRRTSSRPTGTRSRMRRSRCTGAARPRRGRRPRDRRGRADVDALRAAGLARAAVRADRRLVGEVFRLLEFADHRRELGDRLGLRDGIAPRREVALRRLVHPRTAGSRCRSRTRSKRSVRALSPRVEVDRRRRAARGHALAVRLAAVEVDLVAPVDRVLRAHADAGVAARAEVEVDRVFLRPLDVERAEPSGERRQARPMNTGNCALGRQLGAGRAAGDEHGDGELRPSSTSAQCSAASAGPTISSWPSER